MKVIVFAGGVGTRLWPLSRKNTPKQFEKVVGDQSMLQVAVAKLFPDFSWQDIYISTNAKYADILRKQFPDLPEENFILEPEMRDVGPAVGLMTARFIKSDPQEPVAILWGDHLIKNEDEFRRALKVGEEISRKEPEKIVFLGHKIRFASTNLGYIEYGAEVENVSGMPVYEFKGFKYKPDEETAKRYLESGSYSWNLGYFVTTPEFLWKKFEQHAPQLFAGLKQISEAVDTGDYEKVLNEVYPNLEKISFDAAVPEKLAQSDGYVLNMDIGWSDLGAWEALKEALEESPEANVVRGNVDLMDVSNTLAFNYNDQLVVGIDLEGMVVVNTKDVLLICPQSSVGKIKKYVEGLKGTEKENLS